MKRTAPAHVLLLVAVGAALGLFTQMALAASGRPAISPPISLAIVLTAIGIIVVALAIPIRRAVKGSRPRVDPFFALRVLVLAKSSALSGALLSGAAAGFIVHLLTRTVPALGSVGYSVGMAVGAVVLLIGGLVAEEMCRVPPPSAEDDEDPAAVTT